MFVFYTVYELITDGGLVKPIMASSESNQQNAREVVSEVENSTA